MALPGRVLSAGRHDQLRSGIEQLHGCARRRYVPACWFAALYTRLGESDQAFQWMEKAWKQRSNWLIYLCVDPLFDDLRSDTRFQDLAQRVGLPPFRTTTMRAPARKQA